MNNLTNEIDVVENVLMDNSSNIFANNKTVDVSPELIKLFLNGVLSLPAQIHERDLNGMTPLDSVKIFKNGYTEYGNGLKIKVNRRSVEIKFKNSITKKYECNMKVLVRDLDVLNDFKATLKDLGTYEATYRENTAMKWFFVELSETYQCHFVLQEMRK